MRDHDVDSEVVAGRSRREAHDDTSPDHLLGRTAAEGRPDALRPADVLRLQALAGNDGVRSLVQRHEDDPETRVTETLARPGQALAPAVRHDMESALGHDFGDVRVHTDAAAATSAKAVQAQAYTVGSHVVFGEGRYQPGSTEGRRTLAHELTHVVQQRQGPVDGAPLARSAGGGRPPGQRPRRPVRTGGRGRRRPGRPAHRGPDRGPGPRGPRRALTGAVPQREAGGSLPGVRRAVVAPGGREDARQVM